MINKVWFVTGASKGLGLTLTKRLLAAGYTVAATSRTADALIKAVGTEHADSFLPLEVSLTDEHSVKQAITATLKKFGTIDVVVNNAGYGQIGTLEELTDEEVRQSFDINVFGSLNVIRNVMPHFREQGSGRIYNISSIAGFTGNFAGWGIYCSSKFAVAGFTESLAAEAKEFGVYATVVYPGLFRTEFLSQGSLAVPANPISDYKAARSLQDLYQKDIAGTQSGDPVKAADLLIKIAEEPSAPLHLFLGADAYDIADQKIAFVQQEMADRKAAATAMAF
jgi:NAD(P)-dependent dehydrogenase (short-subunit alcohol dehydrogenase family)